MFLEDRRIFYMSLHRHDHGYFYPCTGDPNVVGTGDGAGYNLNIAWNEVSYLTITRQLSPPLLNEVNYLSFMFEFNFTSLAAEIYVQGLAIL